MILCRIVLLGLLLAGVLFVPACENSTTASGDRSGGKLVITGSSTIAPLMADMARQYEQENPGVRIDVQTGGSGKGIADVRNGVAQIGMVSRPLLPEEQDLSAYKIAGDGVGMIVHKDNPVETLSAQQICDIYTGKVERWSEVSGNADSIVVVHKAEGRATLEVFLNHFQLKNTDIHSDVQVGDNQHGIQTVSRTAAAIGYVSIGSAEAEMQRGTPIKLLPLEGVAATSDNVASGAFPMSRPLNLVVGAQPSGLADRFLQYCQSEAVHELIREHYFVPVPSSQNAQP